jgi:bifunctional DNase/RNase
LVVRRLLLSGEREHAPRAIRSNRVTDVQLKVEGVALDWKGNPIVVLREREGQRAVFIWVGISEAQAISTQLEGQTVPRPMTHDLIVLMLEQVDAQLERVVISDMRGGTYYADLHLRNGERSAALDCRPSDAIALAVRADVPIFIDDDLLSRLDEARKDSAAELSPGATVVEPGEPTVH